MKLRVLGAAKEVTGSGYLLQLGERQVLVDWGLHQGDNEEANYEPLPFDATSIDALVLTHAHVDHSGRIPLLCKEGFKGPVFCTLPTAELAELLWRDSAKLMAEDARMRTRKNARRGLPPVEPLYGNDQVEVACKRLHPCSFDDMVSVIDGLQVRFRDAGHIMGSSIVEAFLTEGEEKVKIVFSGDLGPVDAVMEREPSVISNADYVLIESTYGNREHRSNEDTRAEFTELMTRLTAEEGKVFVPTFVVDRAQRVLYELSLLRDQGIGVDMPVFFDSPMGARVTEIYNSHLDLMSSEVQQYRREGHNPFEEGVTYVSSPEESKKLNELPKGIFLAGSGMATGGRITHHLKNNLFDPKVHVVFVGYQARGTLGRALVDGAKRVRINGEEVAVKAKIHTLGGFSAHADRTDLLTWAENFRPSMPQFIVVHGEEESSEALQSALRDRGFSALVPNRGDEFDLAGRVRVQTAPGAFQPTRELRHEVSRKAAAGEKARRFEELAAEVRDLAFEVGRQERTAESEAALTAVKLLLNAALRR